MSEPIKSSLDTLLDPKSGEWDRQLKEASPEKVKKLYYGKSSTLDKLAYGFEKQASLVGMGLSAIEAGLDKDKTFRDIGQEKKQRIEEKYGWMHSTDKESVAAGIGSVGKSFSDPVTWSPLTLSSAVARAGAFMALNGLDAAGNDLIEQGKINPTNVGVSTGLGALGYFTPHVKIGGKAIQTVDEIPDSMPPILNKTKIDEELAEDTVTAITSPQTLEEAINQRVWNKDDPRYNLKRSLLRKNLKNFFTNELPPKEAKAVKDATIAINTDRKSMFDDVLDLTDNSIEIQKATNARVNYINARKKVRSKDTDAPSKEEMEILKTKAKEARDFLHNKLPNKIIEQTETLSDGVMGIAGQLHNTGNLNKNTLSRIFTRPIIGATGGLGIGYTNQWLSPESDVDPFAIAFIGGFAGALTRKINASTFIPKPLKDHATVINNSILKNNLYKQANLLFAGTQAARANVMGGLVGTVGKTLFSQRGVDLSGATRTSIEEAKEIVIQTLNKRMNSKIGELQFAGPKGEEARKAAWKHAEGFIDDAGLAAQGFKPEEIQKIKMLGTYTTNLIQEYADEVRAVGINFGKLDDYVLPQMHDAMAIRKNKDAALAAYTKAFELEGTENAADHAQDFIDNISKFGSGKPIRNAWKPPAEKQDVRDTGMRPLLDHFEHDRVITNKEARKEIQDFLVQDVSLIANNHFAKAAPIVEFARVFGAKGEGIGQLKYGIHKQFDGALKAGTFTSAERLKLKALRNEHIDEVHKMVNIFFNVHGAQSGGAKSEAANTVFSVMSTLANLTYLPKVTISSLGDLVQPFQNSGVWSSMKGMQRTFRNENKDFAKSSGFADMDVMSSELRALTLDPLGGTTSMLHATRRVNEKFFRLVGLQNLTQYSRRFAYNAGIENGFSLAPKLVKNPQAIKLLTRANPLGMDLTKAKYLSQFNKIDDAFKDIEGRKILNQIGIKSADNDSLIPQFGNRLGFTQTKDPYIKSFGQFLSWAQAKTTQTNAMVSRIEDGDTALAVRMMGALVVYDGILNFRQFLNDPENERLEPYDDKTYKEHFASVEGLMKGATFSAGYTPWLLEKVARLFAAAGHGESLPSLSPTLALMDDYSEAAIHATRNLYQEDVEGAAFQAAKVLPLYKEADAISKALTDDPLLRDRPKRATGGKISKTIRKKRIPKLEGGEVPLPVPNAPTNPSERLDKNTKLAYNEQAEGERHTFRVGGLNKLLKALTKKVADVPEESVPIRPVPPKQLDVENTPKFDPNITARLEAQGVDVAKSLEEGGQYVDPRTAEVLTNRVITDSVIDGVTSNNNKPIMKGRLRSFSTDAKFTKQIEEAAQKKKNNKDITTLKTNLLNPEKYKVLSSKVEGLKNHLQGKRSIVTVEGKSGKQYKKDRGVVTNHAYGLTVKAKGDGFLQRVLAKDKKSRYKTAEGEGYAQPSLRPHYIGDYKTGKQIGTITTGGGKTLKKHPLYDTIYIDAEDLRDYVGKAEGGLTDAGQVVNIELS